jgi:hypothetical protein
MLLSGLFLRHKIPAPHFLPGLFLASLAVFVLLGQTKPIVGLVGLGTTSVIAALLVEANRKRIWEEYRRTYRKQKGFRGVLSAPNPLYYTINVTVLWPFILLLGIACLYAAYILG